MMQAIRRSIWQVSAIVALLLMLALGLMLLTSVRSMERLKPVHRHLANLHVLQIAMLDTQEAVLESTKRAGAVSAERLATLRNDVKRLISLKGYLEAETSGRLEKIAELLAVADATGADLLADDLSALHNPDFLKIRFPEPFRFIVSMAHIVSHHRFFTAYGTDPCHGATLSCVESLRSETASLFVKRLYSI